MSDENKGEMVELPGWEAGKSPSADELRALCGYIAMYSGAQGVRLVLGYGDSEVIVGAGNPAAMSEAMGQMLGDEGDPDFAEVDEAGAA